MKVIGQYDSFFFSSISLSATNPKKKQSSNFGTTAAFHGEKKEEKKNNRLSLSQIRGRQFPVVRNDASRKDFFFVVSSEGIFWGREATDGRKNVSAEKKIILIAVSRTKKKTAPRLFLRMWGGKKKRCNTRKRAKVAGGGGLEEKEGTFFLFHDRSMG